MSSEDRKRAARPSPLVAALTILLIAGYRLAPHPWNVAPVGALFVLGGLYMGAGWRALALPFAAVLASDALVYLRWDGSLLHPARLVDYAGLALVTVTARAASGRGLGAKLASVAAAPVIFFLVSNFGVWLFTKFYPHSLQGLGACYAAAIPFFRGTLIGDWLFALSGMAAIEGLGRLRIGSPRAERAA